MTILDLGCGPGYVSPELRSQAPAATVVGVEVDGDGLHQAVSATIAEARRPSFVRADAHALPFADACFDFVHARLLLPYLKEPVAALREALRVLRPKGRLALRDRAYSHLVSPPLFELDELLARYEQLRPRQGWDRPSEDRLSDLLREAGASQVEVESAVSRSQPDMVGTYLDALMGPRKRASLLQSGTVSSREIDDFLSARARWSQCADREVRFFYRMACGVK